MRKHSQSSNEALAKDPKDAKALMLMATIQNEAKEFSAARSSYEKLLAVNPDFLSRPHNLAYLYSEKFDELDKAYDLARKARDLLAYKSQGADDSGQSRARAASDYMRAYASDTLGWVVFKRRDYPYALSLIQESAGKLSTEARCSFISAWPFTCSAKKIGPKTRSNAPSHSTRISPEKRKLNVDWPFSLLMQNRRRQNSGHLGKTIPPATGRPGHFISTGHDLRPRTRSGQDSKCLRDCPERKPKKRSCPDQLATLNSERLHNPAKALELAKEAYKLAAG